jgi:hypothetical protein
MPQPDMHVHDGVSGRAHDIEVKHAQTEYAGIAWDELEQLHACSAQNRATWVVFKFSRRKVCIVRADEMATDPSAAAPRAFDPRGTDSGVRVTKPDTEAWPSARQADADWRVIAQRIGVL